MQGGAGQGREGEGEEEEEEDGDETNLPRREEWNAMATSKCYGYNNSYAGSS